MKEAAIEAQMVRMVHDRGGLCLKWVSPGNNGVPDRIVITPEGRVIFVELKTETGRLSPVQIMQHARLRSRHAEVRTLYGLDQIRAFVEEVMPK